MQTAVTMANHLQTKEEGEGGGAQQCGLQRGEWEPGRYRTGNREENPEEVFA